MNRRQDKALDCCAAVTVIVALLSGCGGRDAGPAPSTSPSLSPSKNASTHASEHDSALRKTAARFNDVAATAGVRFVHRNDEEAGHVSILESLGGGVAMLDYDRNGELDLVFPGGGRYGPDRRIEGLPCGMFSNRGGWTFADVSSAAGLAAAPHYSHAACVADVDSDGFSDILITGYGGLVLFQNQGDGTFRDVTAAARLDDTLWSTSAAWGDLDGDGNLDLYVVHYVDWSFAKHPYCAGPEKGQRETCPPREFKPQPDTLFMSNGDGTFDDRTARAGLRDDGNGLGVLIGDVDMDGDVDVYVGNDSTRNFLYLNDGQGHLEELGLPSGTGLGRGGMPEGSMGVDLGDFDSDGLPDLWTANFEGESFALYRNLGNGLFRYFSRQTGISSTEGLYVGWGTAFFDFDRDMDEDIFVANGHVVRYPKNAPLRQPSLLFENLAGKRFVDVATAAGQYTTAPHMARGIAVGDLDRDGDLDIAICQVNEPVALLSNESTDTHHWISFQLVGRQSNRDAIGAVVRVTTNSGQQLRQIKGGTSFASTNDNRLFFGLGHHDTINRVDIRWPRGAEDVLHDVAADQQIVLHEPGYD